MLAPTADYDCTVQFIVVGVLEGVGEVRDRGGEKGGREGENWNERPGERTKDSYIQ